MLKLTHIIFQLLILQFSVSASFVFTYNYGQSADSTVDSYRDSEQSRVGNYYAPDAGTTQIIRDSVSSTNAQFGNIFADLGNGAYINSDNLSDIIAQVGSNYSPEEQQLFINSILAKAIDFSSTSVVPVSPYLSNLKPALFSESDSLALNNARLKVSGALSSAINSCKGQSCSMTAIKVSQVALDNLINTNINNTLNANYLKRWGENTSAYDAGQKKFKNLIDNLDDRELKDVLEILENQKSIEEELKKTASEWDIQMDNIVEDKEASNLDKYAQDLIDLKTCLGSSANCEMSNSQDNSSEFAKEYKQLDSIYKTSKYINQSAVAPSYKESASNFLSISTDALIGGDLEGSKQFEEIATAIVDIGLGLLPVVGVGKDVYELFTGKNLVTGEELSTFERGLAAVGILTAGGSHYIQTVGKVLGKSARVSEKVIEVGEKVISSAQKLGLKTSEGIKDFADLSKRIVGNDIGAVGDLSKVIKGKMTRFSPIKKGPLSNIPTDSGNTVADTFRSSSYFETLTEEPTKLYRVFDENTSELSAYYSRVKPSGPGQATLDAALDPKWGNTAQKWVEITVPPKEVIYDGIVSEIALKRGGQQVSTGKILGGGSQVYINKKVPRSWITDRGDF